MEDYCDNADINSSNYVSVTSMLMQPSLPL
jgi:hypothetical protein